MKITKILHTISHLKWIFFIWWNILVVLIFLSEKNDYTFSLMGNVLYHVGFYLGFHSLSDITKISSKKITYLQNPKNAKKQFWSLLIALIFVSLLSIFFFNLSFFFHEADKKLIESFTKIAYDLLVFALGIISIIKYHNDQFNYVITLSASEIN